VRELAWAPADLTDINLPIGAIAVAAIVALIPRTPAPALGPEFSSAVDRKFARYTLGRFAPRPGSFVHKLGAIDLIGTVMLLAIVTMLVCVLQWGVRRSLALRR